jgi:hypothetical protein
VRSGARSEKSGNIDVVQSYGRIVHHDFAKAPHERRTTDAEVGEHVLARSAAARKLDCRVITHGFLRVPSIVGLRGSPESGSGTAPELKA